VPKWTDLVVDTRHIKKLIVNKKCCKEKLVHERRLVCKKKEKTVLNVAADAKTWKHMKQMRTIVEFWSPLFAQIQVEFEIYCYVLLLFIYCNSIFQTKVRKCFLADRVQRL
jgi:hypothetical protein